MFDNFTFVSVEVRKLMAARRHAVNLYNPYVFYVVRIRVHPLVMERPPWTHPELHDIILVIVVASDLRPHSSNLLPQITDDACGLLLKAMKHKRPLHKEFFCLCWYTKDQIKYRFLFM